jgi:hypothetical protein
LESAMIQHLLPRFCVRDFDVGHRRRGPEVAPAVPSQLPSPR